MAGLESVPFECYRAETDEYVLLGNMIEGWRVREAKRQARYRAEAASGYDPYNHRGRRTYHGIT
jgi:hypothetical protein